MGDAVMPDFSNTTKRVARKHHACTVCCRLIPPGTEYVETSGKWDGRMEVYRFHVPCSDLYNYLVCSERFWDLPFEGVKDACLESGEPDLIRRWAEVSGADPAPLLREWAGEGE